MSIDDAFTRVSVCQTWDGTTRQWGLSTSSDWGIVNGCGVGTRPQAQAEADKIMRIHPDKWIGVTDLDGNTHYFDKNRSDFVSSSEFSSFKEPPTMLCVATVGCHPYCVPVSKTVFNEKAPLFKGYDAPKVAPEVPGVELGKKDAFV